MMALSHLNTSRRCQRLLQKSKSKSCIYSQKCWTAWLTSRPVRGLDHVSFDTRVPVGHSHDKLQRSQKMFYNVLASLTSALAKSGTRVLITSCRWQRSVGNIGSSDNISWDGKWCGRAYEARRLMPPQHLWPGVTLRSVPSQNFCR